MEGKSDNGVYIFYLYLIDYITLLLHSSHEYIKPLSTKDAS